MSGILVGVIIIALTFYISVIIHELGHFFGFLLNKIPVRMISIAIFSFIFNGSKWEIVFNHSGAGIGGIVIPNVRAVANEAEFKAMQRGYSRAIMGGPLASGLLLVLGLVLLVSNTQMILIALSLIIINIVILLSCLAKADGVYGDFPAYRAYKEDDFFAAVMMYQYTMLGVDYEQERHDNSYLRQLILQGLKPRIKERRKDILTVAAVSTMTQEYLIGLVDQLPQFIKEYINYYYENYPMILVTEVTEANQQLLLLVAYYFKKEGLEDPALEIYNQFIQRLPKSSVYDYWKIQSEQIIKEKDHSQYLLDKNNIKPNLTYHVFKKLEGYYHDELLLNQVKT